MEEKRVGFFERVKTAVAKLENYAMFLEEKKSVAFKYFLLVVLIFTVAMSAVQTYDIMKVVNKGYSYIQNELPDFSYQDGNLEFSQNVYAYDEEFDVYMIADTADQLSSEKIDEYKNQIETTGLIFLKDKAIFKDGSEEIEYKYSDFASQYDMSIVKDKTTFIQKIDQIGIPGIGITIFLTLLIGLYFVYFVSIFMDWLMITLFAYIISRICKINMTFKHVFNISIYALTLPIILNILYNIAYYFTGFYIEYFRTIYLLIAYVYIVAVILMIKSDVIKQQIELAKIQEVQKEVHEELKEKQEETEKENKKPEEDNQEEKNDGDIAGEPDGSEI